MKNNSVVFCIKRDQLGLQADILATVYLHMASADMVATSLNREFTNHVVVQMDAEMIDGDRCIIGNRVHIVDARSPMSVQFSLLSATLTNSQRAALVLVDVKNLIVLTSGNSVHSNHLIMDHAIQDKAVAWSYDELVQYLVKGQQVGAIDKWVLASKLMNNTEYEQIQRATNGNSIHNNT